MRVDYARGKSGIVLFSHDYPNRYLAYSEPWQSVVINVRGHGWLRLTGVSPIDDPMERMTATAAIMNKATLDFAGTIRGHILPPGTSVLLIQEASG